MAQEDSNGLVRPKDAAISCSHFWAYALLVGGISQSVVGVILFIEWRGMGSFWVGLAAMAAGAAGIYVTQTEPAGGASTVLYGLMSLVTLAASLVSVILHEGAAYMVVSGAQGHCSDGDDCPADFCPEDSCVCWEPDGTNGCSDAGSVRHCLRYGGDDCSDIGDSERILRGAFVILLMIAVFSFSSLAVSISTFWYCKRTIVTTDSEDASPYA